MHDEKFYQLHRSNDSCLDILIIWKEPSEIERIYNNKKTADLVLLSIFQRTNGMGGRVGV